jgi:succinyl-diaminopimelate desuccinylase
MKGSAAVLLRLLKDMAALAEPPDVGFQFVSDEEIGGVHGTGMLLEHGWRCDFFLAAEPSDLQICYAHKGAIWAEVELRGQPAHGSRPWEGQNPIAALRDGLVQLERRFPTPHEPAWTTTVVPTVVQGGDAGNRLPQSVQLTLDIRYIPEDSPERIIAAVQECFAGGARSSRSGPPLYTNPDQPEVRRLAACVAAVAGKPAGFYREHFATDARYYSDMGIPAVCLGPTGAGLHSDEEWVEIDSLELLYDALYRFATGQDG